VTKDGLRVEGLRSCPPEKLKQAPEKQKCSVSSQRREARAASRQEGNELDLKLKLTCSSNPAGLPAPFFSPPLSQSPTHPTANSSTSVLFSPAFGNPLAPPASRITIPRLITPSTSFAHPLDNTPTGDPCVRLMRPPVDEGAIGRAVKVEEVGIGEGRGFSSARART